MLALVIDHDRLRGWQQVSCPPDRELYEMFQKREDINTRRDFWFPAKRRGWGWGLPTRWQGKLVLTAFLILMAFGAFVLLPKLGDRAFAVYGLILCLALFAICWLKGERPGWRWH